MNATQLPRVAPLRVPRRTLTVLALLGLLFLPGLDRPGTGAEVRPEVLTSRPRPTPPPLAALKVGAAIDTGAGQRRRLELPDGSLLYVNENTSARLEEPRRLSLSAGEVYVEVAPEPGQDAPAPFVVQTARREVRGRSAGFAVRAAAGGTGVVVTRGKIRISGLDSPLSAGQQLHAAGSRPEAAPRPTHLLSWTRELMTASEAPLVPGSAHAGGALVAYDPSGQETKLSLRKYHVDVHIEDGFARTTIDQTYFNHENERLEGTFYFPLPPDASLSRLAMYVDGNLMEGGMVERELGREVYETIRYQRRDPALLEWVDGSTFKMRVFPLEGRQEKRLLLSYTQKLPSLYGQLQYRFPAGHSLQGVRDWSFHARLKGGAAAGWSSTSHTLRDAKEGGDLLLSAAAKDARVDRDVVLTLADPAGPGQAGQAARFAVAEQDGARYLLVRFRPDLLRSERGDNLLARSGGPRHWVFLFESSGDRDPLLARVQVEVIRHFLTHLEADDTFHVLAAGTRVRSFAGTAQLATPENVQRAVAFLEGSHLIGAFDLGRALTEAEPLLKEVGSSYLVHVGSGVAAMGERREDVLAKRLPPETRYVGVGVGKRWARGFMKAAAERTGGYFTQVNPDEPLAWRAFELYGTVQTLAANPLRKIEVAGVQMAAGVAPRFLYFNQYPAQGEEFCAVARLEGKTDYPEGITLHLGGEPLTVRVPNVLRSADYLPRTWAKLEIERLLAEDAAAHKEQVVSLSKAMYVMTPFTSLLVLENEDMYTQYKVDRGRKDHWAMYPCPQKIAVVYEPDPDGPDAKMLAKSGKLPARQVLKTIVSREPLRFLTSPAAESANPLVPVIEASFAKVTSSASATQPSEPALAAPIRPFSAPGGGGVQFNRHIPVPVQLLMDGSGQGVASFQFGISAGTDTDALGRPVSAGGIRAAGTYYGRSGLERERLRRKGGEPWSIEDFAPNGAVLGTDWGATPANRDLYYTRMPQKFGQLMILGREVTADRVIRRGLNVSREELLIGGDVLAQAKVITTDSVDFDLDQPMSELALHLDGSGKKERAGHSDSWPSLLYARPSYSGQERIFFDLVAYAPGLNTSLPDVRAVLEAEALPTRHNRPGQIDEAARTLFQKARTAGWQKFTLEDEQGRPVYSIVFDGTGRHVADNALPPGIRERVVCDGQTLLHLYPQLNLAARRTVSRFHRADFSGQVPWVLPAAEDLARGADLKVVGERTVAVVPHAAAAVKDEKAQPVEYARVHLVFAADGRLAERQIVHMPKGDILYRQTLTADGVVKLLDGKGQELSVRRGKLSPAPAPELTADTKNLVVLPLPYRTRDHVRQALRIENTRNQDLRFADALQLLASNVAAGDGAAALQVFREALHGREQRQLGLYVLLAACGQNLDAQNADVLAEHLDEPLAQYLALYSSPVLRKHSSQWAVQSGQWGEGFLQHLAVTHALYQRWQSEQVVKTTPAKLKAERQRALDYVRRNQDSVFGWVLLGLLQDRAGDNKEFHRDLAACWRLFEGRAGLEYAARYEHARSLWHGGQRQEARQLFQELHDRTLKQERLPALDGDFRAALLGDGREPDLWSELLRKTAKQLIEQKHRPAVLALARQCWKLDDQPLANSLLAVALEGLPTGAERLPMTLAGIDFLQETGQLPQADELLQGLLDDPKLTRQASLWRRAATIAGGRDLTARRLECLEKALEAEYQDLPEVINLQQVREEYGSLLNHYQALADAMTALKMPPPRDFLARVVRTADRWRALDREATQSYQTAARILRTLGDRELGWDYLTTPVGLRPNEAEPWVELAASLRRGGELELADRAYRAAFEAEPTNAQVLWDRAQNLRQAGKSVEAQGLLRQLAEGRWQPRFVGLQSQARLHLQGP